MRGRSRLISDMAQMANGAATALGGLREEIDNIARQRTERHQNASGLVTREEHDALQTRHEALAARIAVLEAQLAELAGAAAKPAAKKAATKKAAAKKSAPRKA
ncbi:MAG: accessory factor UbiK family protein [Pseudomonadota bacterium]|nr:accessory factor UbiK family protein [Pseudomonadota bacterium]MEC8089433.1 accessory factor UbiK family protein [Pseudomonadota bacterium]MEC8262537.1 accessory factor UbiK family protein [Pseudomonadota bacterium]MEC8805286.1 accessory factor UbiK family protein [Pseudomonadota bacterium]MEC9145232.1 accessory factor UbiK family protein [Pseudomonadota bacterium]